MCVRCACDKYIQCVVCACMCVCCVRDMYIQRCRHAPRHKHIHIRIQMPMYVEVWNIMTFNLDVPDPSKQEQPPDVMRERLWHLFLSTYCR